MQGDDISSKKNLSKYNIICYHHQPFKTIMTDFKLLLFGEFSAAAHFIFKGTSIPRAFYFDNHSFKNAYKLFIFTNYIYVQISW